MQQTSEANQFTTKSLPDEPSIQVLINDELLAAKHQYVFKMTGEDTKDVWKLEGMLVSQADGVHLLHL